MEEPTGVPTIVTHSPAHTPAAAVPPSRKAVLIAGGVAGGVALLTLVIVLLSVSHSRSVARQRAWDTKKAAIDEQLTAALRQANEPRQAVEAFEALHEVMRAAKAMTPPHHELERMEVLARSIDEKAEPERKRRTAEQARIKAEKEKEKKLAEQRDKEERLAHLHAGVRKQIEEGATDLSGFRNELATYMADEDPAIRKRVENIKGEVLEKSLALLGEQVRRDGAPFFVESLARLRNLSTAEIAAPYRSLCGDPLPDAVKSEIDVLQTALVNACERVCKQVNSENYLLLPIPPARWNGYPYRNTPMEGKHAGGGFPSMVYVNAEAYIGLFQWAKVLDEVIGSMAAGPAVTTLESVRAELNRDREVYTTEFRPAVQKMGRPPGFFEDCDGCKGWADYAAGVHRLLGAYRGQAASVLVRRWCDFWLRELVSAREAQLADDARITATEKQKQRGGQGIPIPGEKKLVKRACPDCGGDGIIQEAPGTPHAATHQCGRCNGTGEIEEWR